MDTHLTLRTWRERAAPGGGALTFKAAGKLVGVQHSTWFEWESGARKPSLERALDLERVTEGAVRIEDWGFPVSVAATMRTVLARRDLAATGTG